jgi:hypothetical protein
MPVGECQGFFPAKTHLRGKSKRACVILSVTAARTPFAIMRSKIWSTGLVVFVASGVCLIGVVQGESHQLVGT